MFDSVLDRGTVPEQRFGAGVLFTAAFTLVLGATLYWAAKQPLKQVKKEQDVIFKAFAPPPPPPPPPPLGGASTPKQTETKPTPVKKPDTIYDTKDDKKPKESEKPKDTEKPAQAGGQAGGVEGGVAGGVVGGTVGGTIGGQLGGVLGGQVGGTVGGGGNSVIPFGAGMNRPQKIAGPEIQYTSEARTARIEGTALVKCVITTSGALSGCTLVKGLANMDQAILSAVSQWKMTPVVFNGQPVSVTYTIPIRLKLN
jgi:periplasmic protein TonB